MYNRKSAGVFDVGRGAGRVKVEKKRKRNEKGFAKREEWCRKRGRPKQCDQRVPSSPIVAEMTTIGFFVPLKQVFFEKQLLLV